MKESLSIIVWIRYFVFNIIWKRILNSYLVVGETRTLSIIINYSLVSIVLIEEN